MHGWRERSGIDGVVYTRDRAPRPGARSPWSFVVMDGDVVPTAVQDTEVGCPQESQKVTREEVTVVRRSVNRCSLFPFASAPLGLSSSLCVLPFSSDHVGFVATLTCRGLCAFFRSSTQTTVVTSSH